jgi:hypothetical protein
MAGALWGCRETPHETTEPQRKWALQDFGGVLSVGLEGYRNFDAGRRFFKDRGCASCHAFPDHPHLPSQKGPVLDEKALQYTPEEALQHMLDGEWHLREGRPLLDSLDQAEVLDLLAYVLSGGDPDSPFFRKAQ